MDSIFWFILFVIVACFLILLIEVIRVNSKLENIEGMLERIEFVLIGKSTKE